MNNEIISRNIKGILIDFDGTLIDSVTALYQIYESFLEQYQKIPSKDEFSALNGADIQQIVVALKKNHHLTYDVVEAEMQYREKVEKMYRTIRLFPNAKRALINIKAWGLSIAIVSSAPRQLIEPILGHHQLLSIIDTIITGPKCIDSIPNEALYFEALEALKLNKNDAVVIEDGINGVKASLKAGLTTIWLFPPTEMPIKPDHISASWLEIEELARSWWQNEMGMLLPVSQKIRIRLERDPEIEKVPPTVLSKMDKIWNEELIKSKGRIFNGEIFHVTSWSKTMIKGEFVEYKWLIAQMHDPEIAELLQLKPLAIAGRTVAGEYVLVGKRSQFVTQLPGQIEFSPSGSVDRDACVDETIDYTLQAKKELWEETGLDPTLVREVIPVALQENRVLKTLEMHVDILLDPSASSSTLKRNGEYDWLVWMKME